jgi:branched-chain amino acid aminotransferase
VATAILASVDGVITDPADAKISILDEGLVRGDGAFEVLKLYGNHPFRLQAHLDRLGRSAAAIELEFDREALEAEIAALLERGGAPDGCLRVIVTRGGRRVLTIEELMPFAPSASIALIELSPSEILAGVKSLSYAANMQASRIAASLGADEAVYIRPDGVILEAPTSSIFFTASDGDLRTPSLNAGILDSITRDVLIEELPVSQGTYSRNDLLAAKEAFLASTNREIQPISAVEGIPLPIVGGPASELATEALRRAVDAERSAASD